MNEKTAIRRMKRGDISGLGALVAQHEVKAVRTAYLITRDKALAEDVVQSTFLRIYHRIDQFDDSRPFAPWFMRSVVNAAIQAAKRQQRTLSLDAPATSSAHGSGDGAGGISFADLLPDPAPGPDSALEAEELRATVWDALDKLSPEQRATIVLRYYLELSDDEMADELDIAPGTVRWRLHAARKQLRGLLGRIHGDGTQRYQEGV